MRQRQEVSDPEIDRQEEAWWNDHADTIEAIWAMSATVRPAVRAHYLRRARRFFLEGANGKPAGLLEVGCGSGWVGRMLARDGGLRIIGLDIAEEQIRLARENALQEGLGGSCEYRCQNLADFTAAEAGAVSCVLIHAILHHLSWQEIRSVLAQIKALGAGTRVFLYEPMYLSDPEGGPLAQTAEAEAARSLAARPMKTAGFLQKLLKPRRDRALVKKVEALAVEAQRQGRILSPKEVVFREEEFLALLRETGEVTARYLCNFTSMPVSQLATTFRNPWQQRIFCATALREARRIDDQLFERGQIPLVTREYVFMGYHCVVR